MLNSLFILNDLGDVIIEKHWRGLINRTVCDYFWSEVQKASSPTEVLPVITTPKFYLIHLQAGGLFFLGVLQNEVMPIMVIEFLQRVHDIFADYFGGTVSEAQIKENFVVVYQLLEEMMDNGLPFTTEPNILKEMVRPPNVFSSVLQGVTGMTQGAEVLPDGTLSSIPWRKQGVHYTNNEIFFDIVEDLDCLVDANQVLVSSEVHGEIAVNSKLSGMPDLTLCFSNPYLLDDCSFHPCVRFNRWNQDRVISFIPPDGQFKLMSYRVKGVIQSPIYVKPQISYTESGGRVNVMVGTKMSGPAANTKAVEAVVITIPLPKAALSAQLSANVGSVAVDELAKVARWNIGKIPKEKTPQLQGTVQLTSGAPPPEANPPLQVAFKIVMFTASGLKVESLACSEKFKPYKGVRSVTRAGSNFQVRA